MTSLWSVVCVVCVAVSGVSGQQSVVVNTRYGALKGIRTVTGPQTHVDTFYNIPYAKPPTGPLRFHKPVAYGAWTGTRNASSIGPMCPQIPNMVDFTNETDHIGQEDCLNLNVYTPQVEAGSGPLPVMFWIHGGGYYAGRGSLYDGTMLATKGVVVVTINYRLGALGFLSTQDGVSVGNYGLWDQIRALHWVRDAISAFNGDPNDITIFGQSAGSSSVSLLVLSKETRGLFSKAIMESGASLSQWAMNLPGTVPSARSLTKTLGSRLGCDVSQSHRLVACLMTKDAKDIVVKSGPFQIAEGSLEFTPVAETTFGQYGLFAAVPDVILRNGWFNNVTVIRGFTKDEYLPNTLVYDPDEDGFTMEDFLNATRRDLLKRVKSQYGMLDSDRILDLIVETYVTQPNISDPKQLRAAFGQAATDFFFIAPTYQEGGLYYAANGATQFNYRFSFRSEHRRTSDWQGVGHGHDLAFVFGYPLLHGKQWTDIFVSSWTDDDRRISEEVLTMWTNFAKYGNPTPASKGGLTEWLPWTQATPRYLDLGVKATMMSVLDTPAMRLWNDVFPKLNEAAANTGIIG